MFRTADLLAALSLASDLAIGLPAEHAVRSCYIGMHIADQLQLSADQQVDLYYAQLLMDAGCTAWTSQLAGFILNDEIAARRDLDLVALDDALMALAVLLANLATDVAYAWIDPRIRYR